MNTDEGPGYSPSMKRTLSTLAVLALVAAMAGCSLLNEAKLDYRTAPPDPNHDTEAAKKLNNTALRLLEDGCPEKAEQTLQKALIADVNYGPAHNNLGRVYYCQEKHYLAAWEFEYAIKLMPDRPEPQNNLGLVYESVGKFNEAVEAYECARKLQPNNPEFLGNLARARLQRGDPVAELRPLLTDLVFFDTRPCWVAWAKEQLVLASAQPARPSVEVIPMPPAARQPTLEFAPSQHESRTADSDAPSDHSLPAISIGTPLEANRPRSLDPTAR
jgi:Tfp pilus assembly protein PilF